MNQYRKITLFIIAAFCSAVLFPYAHSAQHFYTDLSEKRCLHAYDENQTTVSHAHLAIDKCFQCELRISPYTAESWSFSSAKYQELSIVYHAFHYICTASGYVGFCKSLRAPPIG